jgi:hypothetical protein
VARRFGLDVKKLIDFSFKINDPGVVNWYLRVKVGCRLHDENNWKFSKNGPPGVIYRPSIDITIPENITLRKGGKTKLAILLDDNITNHVAAHAPHFILDVTDSLGIAA